MSVEVTGPGETVIVRLHGDLDQSMQAPLLCAFDVARGRTTGSILVDCSDVDFVDSCAVGQLLNAVHRVEGDGHFLRLIHVPECMEGRMRNMNLWEHFDRRQVVGAASVSGLPADDQALLVSFG